MAGDVTGIGFWGVPLEVAAGAVRIGTPFLFVSLGECLTEKSGRVNLGLEGTLVMGAMSAYGISYYSGSAWLGVLVAGLVGAMLGGLHGWLCSLPRVNDVAIGIALISFGTGLAFFLGKPFIQPTAPKLPAIDLGFWSGSPEVRSALQINALFVLGLVLAPALKFMLERTRWGLVLRTVGESADAARAMGYDVNSVRAIATVCGGFFAGIAGSFLSLFYPGSWNERLSSGQGLMAVALVIFAHWSPTRCLWAALLFGASSALGPALQSVGISAGYQLFNAVPYVLTLGIMVATSSASRRLPGQPAELTVAR
jgi:simple sugar transport system permease protein